MYSNTDWDTVTYLRKPKQAHTSAKSDKAVKDALRKGEAVDTRQKYGAATNKKPTTSKNTAKLDRETEELHHDRVSLTVARLIQQGRQQKELSRKDLAMKINEKVQVVSEYESGKAIPNDQVMGKIERAIGIKLRGKDKGKPLNKPKPKQ